MTGNSQRSSKDICLLHGDSQELHQGWQTRTQPRKLRQSDPELGIPSCRMEHQQHRQWQGWQQERPSFLEESWDFSLSPMFDCWMTLSDWEMAVSRPHLFFKSRVTCGISLLSLLTFTLLLLITIETKHFSAILHWGRSIDIMKQY